MLIELSGKIGSGKSTAADLITQLLPNVSIQQVAYAHKLKLVCSLLTGYDVKDFESQEFKEMELDAEWDVPVGPFPGQNAPITIRMLMQRVGTEAMRKNVHPNVWVNALFADYEKRSSQVWIVTDVRFENEAEAIKKRGGVIIRLERDYHVKSNHESETALDNYKFDYVIKNNKSIEELAIELCHVLVDLRLTVPYSTVLDSIIK